MARAANSILGNKPSSLGKQKSSRPSYKWMSIQSFKSEICTRYIEQGFPRLVEKNLPAITVRHKKHGFDP